MIVRLHNLSARAPEMHDLKAVVALLAKCDITQSGLVDSIEEDVRAIWQARDFNLKTDAWAIVTKSGQLVGYSDVRSCEEGHLLFMLSVHPEYCGRGIETLLIWLVEERARQLMSDMPSAVRVVLSHHVSNLDQAARELLEHEGYGLVRHFWHLLLEMDEMSSQDDENLAQGNTLRMDLIVDARQSAGIVQASKRGGRYSAYQYDVYEKELRAGNALQMEDALVMCSCAGD